ncbi:MULTISPECIES: DUF1236 domain-containing protein [unclassified Bosea (in: a-proteobacteria)]|uniref:DUF1236 domain-containing protein n=1 Tax=unclassified Bosea (in: a-proteobacteria) TaxID=2653178 RepID=UPI000F764DF9|nr:MULTISPECIES: DUF1236 domain-containing protein [unclassified Bosea (in: a-proteobacteria)]AZO82069.1 hypothetical protein BLM15_30245 [Bosea sp. Tri-49]RXT24645.1 hypothetical protein B5U98_08365 [Bosea sp. Tri-39]RXT42480.1 hypothetical protein B5U99_00835 [Bosea sp. Tri-54]
MLRNAIFAAGLILLPATAMAQGQGQPNGLPEPPSMRSELAPRFKQYVVTQRPTSYSYAQPLSVGTVLPQQGVTYRDVPAEYGVSGYRYTVVNDRTVLVEPSTGRIVQIIE